ncbi:hypothetical protein EYZ11_000212 [Aspergillus tanneri]|uniref:Uncharacterized protein n=1 Tax=Aspergillus tanneri TaxID=1220188 RepID=A0A4S3JXQ4_9EURO|nr:hypothetical protein EYZ11_000212 [Aspergillus tanneri]
MATSGPGAHF